MQNADSLFSLDTYLALILLEGKRKKKAQIIDRM